LARSLGQASKEFKKGISDEENDDAGGTEAKDNKKG
jgi:Sec-independent protein translocase protein TatA